MFYSLFRSKSNNNIQRKVDLVNVFLSQTFFLHKYFNSSIFETMTTKWTIHMYSDGNSWPSSCWWLSRTPAHLFECICTLYVLRQKEIETNIDKIHLLTANESLLMVSFWSVAFLKRFFLRQFNNGNRFQLQCMNFAFCYMLFATHTQKNKLERRSVFIRFVFWNEKCRNRPKPRKHERIGVRD